MQIILLLVVLGGLTLLLVENWSPVLPLVFLGVTTQPLPLALWILMSVGAGAFTSLVVTGLFNLSGYFARLPRDRRKVVDSKTQPSGSRQTVKSQKQPATDSTPSDTTDDWDSNSSDDDDWDFEEDEGKSQNSSSQKEVKSTNYEVSTEPQSSNRSGSVYSYNYRSSNSGVGKTESVYDANYRIITPPSQQTNKTKDDDDWGFEDEDDKEETKD